MQSLGQSTIGEYLAALAEKAPAPGGGAAAALAGANAAALAGMVIAYSLGKKSLDHEQLEAARARTASIAAGFLDLADEDAEAYAALNALQRLPRTDPARAREEPAAAARATAAPSRMLETAVELLELLESLCGRINPRLGSDLAISAVLAESACAAAAWSVRVNAPLLPEPERPPLLGRAEEAVLSARALRERIEQACR